MATPVKNRVKDLFDLPQSVHKIGFVEELSRAVTQPKVTAETYVVTPALLGAFHKSLDLVGGALRDGRSRAGFLQGSFGSGKSHFMALLSLLLEGDEHAWRIPELHVLREKHGFCGTTKLLQLRFHLIGHGGNLESAIFGRYIDTVKRLHPNAPLPGVFADEKLFDDARRMLGELGDERFFQPMNAGKESAGWGDIAEGDLWSRARFDAVAASTDPREREALFNALVRTRFGAFADESRQFVDLDEGLSTLARHAKSLGYEGVVLFLDELILWLATHVGNLTFFHTEVQKVVKLVEAQDSHRQVPFISFIARQRDLAELVGRDHEGMQNALVRDSLKWSEGRFDTLLLEDRNLPAIAEKRILKPKGDAAKKALDDAFKTMRAKLGDNAWQLLLGELDEKEFRRLYPFSPVLMDALVALSSSLQRERTAIRLLTELLVEHVEDLQMGDVVGVGDLFDVIAGGDDSTDGIMRARFDAAKQLYTYQFLPVIQHANGTTSPDRCQRLRPDHPARIGCSNCPERACRADNRLAKTLLVAALISERPALKELTASKLVQLNHGSLRAPIPGTEVTLVAQKLRNWASTGNIAQLHVGVQTDPTVRVDIDGVETGPILEQARQFDTPSARQRVLKDLLFKALGIEGVPDWGKDLKHDDFRGTTRCGHLRFGNVRKMSADLLLCPPGHDFRLIVDYPFDDDGYGPGDDEKTLDTFLQGHAAGTWTIVWLPTFFSKEMVRVLGDLVVLEHILSDRATTRQYVSHLAPKQQEGAVTNLINLQAQKQNRIRQVLEQAYGLVKPREGDLDLSNAVETHVHVLKPGVQVRFQLAATLGDAVYRYADELLASRYRLHPKFPRKLTKTIVELLVARFGEIVDSEDKSIAVDRETADLMRGFLGELGLVRVTEDKAFLREDDTLQRLENLRQKKALARPEVGEVRSWIDDTGARGLQDDALDLVVRCYARWSARTLLTGDLPYEVKPGQEIPDHVVLEQPDLPTHAMWMAALNRAGDFGITLSGRALHGDNLKKLEALVVGYFKPKQTAAMQLPGLLAQRLAQLGIAGEPDRLVTARSGDDLSAQLAGKKGKALVETLAAFEPKTSGRALADSFAGADDAVREVKDDLGWGTLDQVRCRPDGAGGEELLDGLGQALRQDELHQKIGPRVRELAKEALLLLKPKPDLTKGAGLGVSVAVAPLPIGAEEKNLPIQAKGKAASQEALAQWVDQVKSALTAAGDDVEMVGSVRLVWRRKS
ncbi:MAG: hypothetical protein IPK82_21100 [Polyangiaceae bacterium]|nr:hypothetical protein [Polyangiaceae bacterium]